MVKVIIPRTPTKQELDEVFSSWSKIGTEEVSAQLVSHFTIEIEINISHISPLLFCLFQVVGEPSAHDIRPMLLWTISQDVPSNPRPRPL